MYKDRDDNMIHVHEREESRYARESMSEMERAVAGFDDNKGNE